MRQNSAKNQAHKSPTPAQIKYFRPALWKVSPVLFYILQSSAHRIAQFYVSICRIACTIAIKSCSFNSAIPCSSSPRTINTSPGFMSKIFLAFAGITICPFSPTFTIPNACFPFGKHLRDQPALLHIREGLSRLVFGKCLSGHINLLRQFLLRHSTHLPQHHQIIFEHVSSPFSLQSHTIL